MSKPQVNKPAKPDPKAIRVVASPGDDPAAILARCLTRPSVQAAVTIQEFADRKGETELTVNALIDELQSHCDAANAGNLAREEAMLTAQAHTLDAIFNALARRAVSQEYLAQYEAFMRLALKAQSQCRATVEALATIKNPQPVAFVRQANIAAGPQQVNNGIPAGAIARAGKNEIEQSKLAGSTDELLPDAGASALGSGNNPPMATVAKFDRTENRPR